MELKDKVALITGASSGIGKGVAEILAQKGVKVVLAARSESKLHQIVDDLTTQGFTALACPMDVADKKSVQNAIEKIKNHFGKIDILINNAGIMPAADIDTFKINEWDQMVDINIKGVLNVTAAVLPELIQQRNGHIINLSSIAGRKLFKGLAVYCGTKYFVAAFSDIMRMEIGKKYNIRVTSIQPGAVATNLYDQITDTNYKKGMESLQNQMTFLTPNDIANSMIYALESPDYVDVSEIFILPTDQEW
ncbi:SDR family oxidoreductase [Rhizosphaericola mali]|uniref:SDR family oxidoreductase n=1 Tax=Rhizosphaericola mali TaxID=2545455 RepID=A0A5P2G5Q4_9BACT|nr:SDR family oxidoreductase [Rhizosphaericola mali]QES88453.1 SDR family oxidoreductase [Rhizosphaericola mali]